MCFNSLKIIKHEDSTKLIIMVDINSCSVILWELLAIRPCLIDHSSSNS